MNPKYLLNPFDALYQDSSRLSNKPEIQELNQYAIDLESQIEGDFNLDHLIFEFAHNQLAFVRQGLILAKVKFMRLHKNYGDGTFASFCKHELRKQRWQINNTIKASTVVLTLMYHGFEILPANVAQAVALAKLSEEELVKAWKRVIDTLPGDKITARSIGNLIFPTSEKETTATIKVPAKVHEDIHREAANLGISVAEFLGVMLDFFIGKVAKDTFLESDINTEDYREKQRIWEEDLADLVAEKGNSTILAT